MKREITNRNRLLGSWLTIIALGSVAPLAHADESAVEATYQATLEEWAFVLRTYVDDEGRTDFRALAQSPEPLQRVVNTLADYGPTSHPSQFPDPEFVLAYHINTYNALAMHGIIERQLPTDLGSFFKRASFFRFRTVLVDGRKTNLYDYENKVIRPLNDPRAHFALNCMVRDCPRLPRSPFTAAELDRQLNAATVEFLNSEKYLRIDNTKRTINVSSILDFYTEDFVPSGKRRDLPTYINRYRSTPLPADFRIRYLPYDWTVNRQP